MPDFVKKLIAKKGRENVKMPYLVKKMLEKKSMGKNMISCYCLKVIWRLDLSQSLIKSVY